MTRQYQQKGMTCANEDAADVHICFRKVPTGDHYEAVVPIAAVTQYEDNVRCYH